MDLADEPNDELLALAIRKDAESIRQSGQPVRLQRYLDSVPSLMRRPIPLDAAIEVAMDDLMGSTPSSSAAALRLAAEYPQLAVQIAEAAAFNDILLSTSRIVQRSEDDALHRLKLPSEFGPDTPEGEPRFVLERLLGIGAFGAVYKAVDRLLTKNSEYPAWVAIKVLHSSLDRSHRDRNRFADEAAHARRIRSPHVVSVLDRGKYKDAVFIVYEYVAGESLDVWRRNHAGASTSTLVRVAIDAARGVQAAHSRGLLHCDLKPHNVLIDSETSSAKVTDFGVAQEVRASPLLVHSEMGARYGNLGFIAPEQFRNEPSAFAFPSDIYALGGLLYWLLFQEAPNGKTRSAVARNLGGPGRDPVAELAPEATRPVDPTLLRIMSKALQWTPEARYASASAFADDLQAWLEHRPTLAHRLGMWGRSRLWCKRQPVMASLALGCVAVAIGAGVVLARTVQETIARTTFEKTVERIAEGISAGAASGKTKDVLPELWILEWIYSYPDYGSTLDPVAVWDIRADAITKSIQKAEAAGERDTMRLMMWKKALAFWCLQCEREEEAIAAIDDALRVPGAAQSADPFFQEFRDLRDIGVILRARSTLAKTVGIDSDLGAELGSATSRLWARFEGADVVPWTTDLRCVALEAIGIAAGPGLLDDQALAASSEAALIAARGGREKVRLRLTHR